LVTGGDPGFKPQKKKHQRMKLISERKQKEKKEGNFFVKSPQEDQKLHDHSVNW